MSTAIVSVDTNDHRLWQRNALAAQRSSKLDAAASIHNGAGGQRQGLAGFHIDGAVGVDGQRTAIFNGHI